MLVYIILTRVNFQDNLFIAHIQAIIKPYLTTQRSAWVLVVVPKCILKPPIHLP